MPKRATALHLNEQEEEELTRLTKRHRSEQQVVLRARIILAAAQGASNAKIARDTIAPWPNPSNEHIRAWLRTTLNTRNDESREKRTGEPMEEQREDHPTTPASDASVRTKEQWLRVGRDLCGTIHFTEALHAFEEVIRLDPTNVEAYYTKSYILYSLYQDKDIPEEVLSASQEAINVAEQALLLNPNDADAYFYKGMALSDQGRYEEAIPAYEQIIRLEPTNFAGYSNKGNALAGLNRYEEAISVYEYVLHLDPSQRWVYTSIGHALRRLGRETEAQRAYEQARGPLPKNAQ